VAEISLDEVHLQPSGSIYHEVELELMEAGSENDLAILVAALRNDWKLQPEPLSKFERALETSRSNTDRRENFGDVGAQTVEMTGAETAGAETGKAPPGEPEDASPDSAEPPAEHTRKQVHSGIFLGDGLEVLSKPGVEVDDPMSAAANKLLLFHLQRMMKHEPGTRAGEDPEELHDMRVATRRMRAALRVFSDYLNSSHYKPFLKLVRSTGRELGAVRDLDVFRIKTDRYIDSLPPSERSGLDPLMEAWAEERERARAELVAYLDSSRYQRRKEEFEYFLRTPGAGAGPSLSAAGEPLPNRVGDVLPAILFDRLASVRAFDHVITQPDAPIVRFHELRIVSKGLRYTLEFFQEVLGPGSKPLIETMKAVQDHLGDLQDAAVTCDVLLGFLGSGTWGPPRSTEREGRLPRPVNAPGVAGYLAAKQSEIETLTGTFGPVWERLRSPEFSRPLAELVGAL
jgi:CHAD domain-containing protein